MRAAYAGSRWRRGVSIFASTCGSGGDHQGAGAGRDEHHAAYPPARLDRELLGQSAAPGQAEHVELLGARAVAISAVTQDDSAAIG